MSEQKVFDDFVDAARLIAKNGLVSCASGNLSCRFSDNRMLITTTDSWMERLTADEIAVCSIGDMKPINGKKPSKEIGFHDGILRCREDVNVVLHYQSPNATTAACLKTKVDNFFVIPEIAYYIGPVAEVPFLMPGSEELADAVTDACINHDLALLRNHGQVVVGKSFNRVVEKAMYFELACGIILGSAGNNDCIPQALAEELVRLGKSGK